ncbi:hypothetical protein MRX96_058611 [Rhipicephalus microplus]
MRADGVPKPSWGVVTQFMAGSKQPLFGCTSLYASLCARALPSENEVFCASPRLTGAATFGDSGREGSGERFAGRPAAHCALRSRVNAFLNLARSPRFSLIREVWFVGALNAHLGSASTLFDSLSISNWTPA